jgi:hypothetical protein
MKIRVMQSTTLQLQKLVIRLSLCAFVLVSFLPQSVSAQEQDPLTPAAAIIKYLGLVEEKLLFNVDINNGNAERCTITIQDEAGEVLYKQEFKDARFVKTFAINKEELAGKNLVFILNKGKAKQEQVYQVSTTSRVVEDVNVAKL